MKKKLQISIPDPCHENRDQMNPAEKGRYCTACRKTVIDFTGMSDVQLAAFFKKPSTGSVCGRFMNDQLDREIALPHKRIPWLKYLFRFSIPVFLAGMKSQAQAKIILYEKTEASCSQGDTVGFIPYINVNQKEVVPELRGKVTDQQGVGVPYASVIVKGTHTGTVSDNAGFFKLKCKTNQDSVTLVSSSVGYENAERTVFLNTQEPVEVILVHAQVLSGEVVVVTAGMVKKGGIKMGTYGSRKISFAEKLSGWLGFKKDTASIFPNPVQRWQSVTIEFSSMNEQPIRALLMSMDGKLVGSRNFAAAKGVNRFQFRFDPGIAAGIYIVAVKNEKGVLIKKEKIQVQ